MVVSRDVEGNKYYDLLFHPLAEHHSPVTKIVSTVIIVALSILTSGAFLIIFGAMNLKDYNSQVKKLEESSVLSPTVRKKIYEPSLSPSNPPSPILFNESTSINGVNIEKIRLFKLKHKACCDLFDEWGKTGQWSRFTTTHLFYDLQIFPTTQASPRYGNQYAFNSQEIDALKSDSIFLKNYRLVVEIIVNSWGWNLRMEHPFKKCYESQGWAGYWGRLERMANSLYDFQQKDFYIKLQKFYKEICLPLANRYPIEPSVTEALFKSINHMSS